MLKRIKAYLTRKQNIAITELEFKGSTMFYLLSNYVHRSRYSPVFVEYTMSGPIEAGILNLYIDEDEGINRDCVKNTVPLQTEFFLLTFSRNNVGDDHTDFEILSIQHCFKESFKSLKIVEDLPLTAAKYRRYCEDFLEEIGTAYDQSYQAVI